MIWASNQPMMYDDMGINPPTMYYDLGLHFSGPQGSWIVCCLRLKKSSALGGVNGVASFISTDEQLQ